MVKKLIKKRLRECLESNKTIFGNSITNKLVEVEYNYHYGNNVDTESPKPYGSDSIKTMSGRGTGHFGSGLYFSTYTCNEKRDVDDKFGEYSDFDRSNKSPNLIQLDDGLYRVNMDLYKNLYRVTSNNHGDILFTTLKQINELFYWAKEDLKNGKIRKGFSDEYLKIKHNLSELKLKTPTYKEFIKLYTNGLKDGGLASMSTRIMEYFGYNGVNVSNIPKYDNTTHGSVIYDISKIDSKPKKVETPNMFCKVEKGVAGESRNIKTDILRGKEIHNWGDFNELPSNTKLALMKRYNYYTLIEHTDMDNESERLYFLTLPSKMRSKKIEGKFTPDMVKEMIDNGLIRFFYDKEIKISGQTLLSYIFDYAWGLPDEDRKRIVDNINRELNNDEKESLETFI